MEAHPLSKDLNGLVYWSVNPDGDLAMAIREIRRESQKELGVHIELWALRVPSTTKPELISFITLRDASVLFTVVPSPEQNDHVGGDESPIDSTTTIMIDQICFQYDFRLGLLENRLLHFDYSEKRMVIAEIRTIEGLDDHLPPIQWLEFVGDRVLLIGSQDVCQQDTLEPGPRSSGRVLSHRGARGSLTPADHPLMCCSLCLHSAAASTCHICDSCTPGQDSFIICSSCLRQGAWCSDISHTLCAATNPDRVIRWRPSHVFLEVPMVLQDDASDESATRLRPRFQERLGSVVNHLPTTEASTKSLFWLLDDVHILAYNIETDKIRVIPLERDNPTYSPTHACVHVGSPTLYKLYNIPDINIFTCYVGTRLTDDTPSGVEWLFWMTVYQCTDLTTARALSSTYTLSQRLDAVRADSEPTVMILRDNASVTYINGQGQLQAFGLHFVTPAPNLSRRQDRDEKLQALENDINNLASHPNRQNAVSRDHSERAKVGNNDENVGRVIPEFEAVTLVDNSDSSAERPQEVNTMFRQQEDIVYSNSEGQSERIFTLSHNTALEKVYTIPSLDVKGTVRAIIIEGNNEDPNEFLVMAPNAHHPQTLPVKLAITEKVVWGRTTRDGLLDQVAEGISKLRVAWMEGHDEENDRDTGFQSGIRPHTLCDACVSVVDNLHHADSLPIWTGNSHASYKVGQEWSGRDIRHRLPEWAVVETGMSFYAQDPTKGSVSASSTTEQVTMVDSSQTQATVSPSEPTPLDDEHIMHHHSLQSMAKSILRGCHLCTHFRSQMDYNTRCELDELMKGFAADDLGTISTRTEGFAGYPRRDVSGLLPKSPVKPEKLEVATGAWWHRPVTREEELVVRVSQQTDDLGAASVDLTLYQAKTEDEPRWKAEVTVRKLSDATTGLGHKDSNSPISARASSSTNIVEDREEVVKESQRVSSHGSNAESKPRYTMKPSATRFTSSAETMLLAGSWLTQCLGSHNCLLRHSQTKPPTRVIDICPDGLQSNVARLHVTTPDDKYIPYVALSHCWGAASPRLQLTRITLKTLCEGFDVGDLPDTFRDAVNICRTFNIRYLWIDSLCIIQGDKDDWEKEAATMASVYGNAICTIAARASTSTESGCFAARNRLKMINLVWQDRQGQTFMIQGENSDVQLWDTRGWVYQERLLSARVLSFSSDGISWDCNEMSADETDYEGTSNESAWATVSKSKELMSDLLRQGYGPLETAEGQSSFLSAWYDTVESYSRLRLSHEKDRMIAIAGIATRISDATRYNYYYGLWHSIHDPHMLLSQLLWMAQYPVSGELYDPSRNESCPPSFSWLAAPAAKPQYCITFHDRRGSPGSLHHTTIRSTFMSMTMDDANATAYIELLNRNGSVWLSHDTHYEGRPLNIFSKTDVMFHCKLHELVTPDAPDADGDAVFTPRIVLTGPVRNIHIKARDAPYQYEYPWPEGGQDAEEEGDWRGRFEWFFPDTLLYPTRTKCLTVATWRRAWDGRWYAAGLVLGSCQSVSVEREEQIKPMMRVGYFEHSWAQKVPDFYDHGLEETIALV